MFAIEQTKTLRYAILSEKRKMILFILALKKNNNCGIFSESCFLMRFFCKENLRACQKPLTHPKRC